MSRIDSMVSIHSDLHNEQGIFQLVIGSYYMSNSSTGITCIGWLKYMYIVPM